MRRPLAIAILLAPLAAGAFILQDQDDRAAASRFDRVLRLVSSTYVDSVGSAAIYEKAAKGLVTQLGDPYSELLAPRDLEGFTTRTGGRYGGVGMLLEQQNAAIIVTQVYPKSPAERAGVRAGDRIVRVDSTVTRDRSVAQVSELLLGEPGTPVRVTFARQGVSEPIEAAFTRATIHIPAVPYTLMLDDRIGYVPILTFNDNTAQETWEAVRRLTVEGARGLIIDVRGNPGGIVEQAVAVAGLFVPRGTPVASYRGRGIRPGTLNATTEPIASNLPLVVMVDGFSASAAEIVAGALQDHDRALVVGTRSFGKGLIQNVYPLDGGWALKLTVARWYTPSGRSIHTERSTDGRAVASGDTIEAARPVFTSTGGRRIVGGGGVTPDVTAKLDTATAAEQQLARIIAPQSQGFHVVLYGYALELSTQVPAGFEVAPLWRDSLHARLESAGVRISRAEYDAAAHTIDRLLGQQIATIAFGDSTAKRRAVRHDRPLMTAIDLLSRGRTQSELFATAQERRDQL